MTTIDDFLADVDRLVATRRARDTVGLALAGPARSAEQIVADVYAAAERDAERRQDAAEEYRLAHPELTGYHEAAHAVVAHALNHEVTEVRISPSAERGEQGCTGYFPLAAGTDLQLAEDALICLAGRVGERMCRSWNEGQEHYHGHHDDHERARRLLGGDEGLLRDLEAEARRILDEHWGTVEHLAAELVERGEMAGPALALFMDAPHRPGPGGQVMTWVDRAGTHGHFYLDEHRPLGITPRKVACWPTCPHWAAA